MQTGGTPHESIKEFVDWLLHVRDGQIGDDNDGEIDFKLPDDILIHDATDPITAMVISTYHSLIDHIGDGLYFQDRSILAPTNEIVHEINEYVMSLLPSVPLSS